MSLYQQQFSEAFDFAPRTPEKFLIIASTPRCGSHMLGHTLHQTGRFGFPLEYAQPSNLKEWARLCGTEDALDTIRAIMERRTSGNGVFSIKLHYSHIDVLGGFRRVQRLFPNASIVLLTRHQALRQAVSLAIATQTGVWIDGQGPAARAPVYDRVLIDRCLRRVLHDNAAWRYLLAANGCRFLDLDFDTAKKDIKGTVESIARFAGISLEGSEIPEVPVTRRQGSSLNGEWERRFIAEHPGDVLSLQSGPGPAGKWSRSLRKVLDRGWRVRSAPARVASPSTRSG